MRVASRRLRVALPALAQKPRGKIVRRCRATLQRIVRLAGPARDLDVAFSLFREVPSPARARGPHWSVLRRRLRESRRRSHARFVQSLLDADLASLRRDLRRVAARTPVESSVAQARLARRLAAERDRFILGFRRLGDRLDVDALHALRRGVRRLRYIAELQEELSRRVPRASGSLKDLQDRLGSLRDVAILARWLAAQASRARRLRARALARVGSAGAKRLGVTVGELHAEFLDRTPLAVVSRVAGVSAPGPGIHFVRR